MFTNNELAQRFLVSNKKIIEWKTSSIYPLPYQGTLEDIDNWVRQQVLFISMRMPIIEITKANKLTRIISTKANVDFFWNHLSCGLTDEEHTGVMKAHIDQLIQCFYGGLHPNVWYLASKGILLNSALQELKRIGDSKKTPLGFECQLYALYIRSLINSCNKKHPDLETYISGILGAGAFDEHWDEGIVTRTKWKYGSALNKGLVKGSTNWTD
ncbi:hypothetical protein [Paenibacillus odorifer]|uniref:hypothetical protein n=1 Tax=Paenibacillus odorifer TaxID=189426 RepID=UPI00096EDE9C|nr:hypothetical protein [Paenibacillus odorifer]OMD61030.1 hypothetical protein BSK55_06735 [Paenibacillus odorifer]